MTNMKKLKDKWITSSVRYSKVFFNMKTFRRFEYFWKEKSIEILWLSSQRELLPTSVEEKLEKEFQQKVG